MQDPDGRIEDQAGHDRHDVEHEHRSHSPHRRGSDGLAPARFARRVEGGQALAEARGDLRGLLDRLGNGHGAEPYQGALTLGELGGLVA